MPRTIKIHFKPNGEVKLETSGYAGVSCQEASKRYEKALGRVADDTPKAEMFSETVDEGGIAL